MSQQAQEKKQRLPSNSLLLKMGVWVRWWLYSEWRGQNVQEWGSDVVIVVGSADDIWGEIQLDGHDPPCQKWRMPRDGGIHGLGQAVGIDTGFGWEWWWWGHWCLCLYHFGVVHHVLGSRVDSQMDVIIAIFIECQEADLALTLPLVLYCHTAPSPACPPSTASMLYPLLYASIILGLSPPFPLIHCLCVHT
ncbi:hypothetical protein EV421DRAFT_1905064 [Armillaria borealis]|uniref:Uncharacterized protein n=1 Tax=Armillaria borealis TaxID=47425 RepID=A0AA39MNR0_9AGAR|nr:hypothetical protein EV421DRAFT_1905064 [Armillaria borealis]